MPFADKFVDAGLTVTDRMAMEEPVTVIGTAELVFESPFRVATTKRFTVPAEVPAVNVT